MKPVDSHAEETNSLNDAEIQNFDDIENAYKSNIKHAHKSNENFEISSNYKQHDLKLQYSDLGRASLKRAIIDNRKSNEKFEMQFHTKRCPSGFFMISDQCIGIKKIILIIFIIYSLFIFI